MQSLKVVILCGGLGTRLREETEHRPGVRGQIDTDQCIGGSEPLGDRLSFDHRGRH